MEIEIRETIVTPKADDAVVQLHISDRKLEDESASFVLRLSVEISPMHDAQLSTIQREALKRARKALQDLIDSQGLT